MRKTYPNLIEITTFGDTEPVYIKGQRVLDSDLTDAEKELLERSRKIMRNKYDEYVNALDTRNEKYPNYRDVICGNCEKVTNVFNIDFDTGRIYFYCPHCGELNRLYSV